MSSQIHRARVAPEIRKRSEFPKLVPRGDTTMMFSPNQWLKMSARILLIGLAIFTFVSVAMSQDQSSAADLLGVVHDRNGAVVPMATVMMRYTASNVSRQ